MTINVKATALALMLSIVPAYAGPPVSGRDWVAECNANLRDAEGRTRQYMCMRYARGLADGLMLWRIVDPQSAKVCIPELADAQQLAEVGKKFFRENPKEQHVTAGELLSFAFRDAWPCEKTPDAVWRKVD